MTFKSSTLRLGATLVALATASGAVAQTAPAPPPLAQGPAIPGMCVVSQEGALSTAAIGKFVYDRLQTLAQQARAPLVQEQTAIQAEDKAIQVDAQKPGADQGALEQRAATLQVRAKNYERNAQHVQAEMQATQQKANFLLRQAVEPLIVQIYQQKGCSILLEAGNAVVLSNNAMDISEQLVTALNAKVTQIPLDRVRLDAQGNVIGGAPPAGGAPPIIQTPAPTSKAPAKK